MALGIAYQKVGDLSHAREYSALAAVHHVRGFKRIEQGMDTGVDLGEEWEADGGRRGEQRCEVTIEATYRFWPTRLNLEYFNGILSKRGELKLITFNWKA